MIDDTIQSKRKIRIGGLASDGANIVNLLVGDRKRCTLLLLTIIRIG